MYLSYLTGQFLSSSACQILAFDPVVDGANKKTSFNFPEDVTVSKLKFYPVSWEKFAAIQMQLWGYYKGGECLVDVILSYLVLSAFRVLSCLETVSGNGLLC